MVTHVHQWRQEVDLDRQGLLTTADFTQRRSSPDAETPSWFVSYRFASWEPQSHARFEREVAVNFDHGAIGAELGALDRLRHQFLWADQSRFLAVRSCSCSSGTASIRFIARL